MDTANLKTLDAKKTRELLKLSKEGDDSARNEIILGNLKLVLSLVNKFARQVDNLDDLFQIGTIGLIKAIDNFDLNQDVRFSTYAVPMILGEIKRYLRDNSFLRVSRQIKDRAYKALKVKEAFIANNQREPTPLEIAKELDVSPYEIVEAFDAVNTISSLSEPLYNDFNESLELIDVIPSDNNNVEKMFNSLSLEEGLKHLSPMENKIIKRRYFDGKTQLEIAREFSISQAQVSRLEKNALRFLKTFM